MTPTSRALSSTKVPPTTTIMPMAMPVKVSTIGTMACANLAERRWLRRFSAAFSVNRSKFTTSRPRPWTVRTACIPSASAPFAEELVSRAVRKAMRARGSQTRRTKNSTGTTDKVSRPSQKSSASMMMTIPTSSTKSPIAVMEFSRNS